MFFSERFLAPRPLLEAIRSEEPVVLLIDEVDRADEALEAVLLETLGEYQVSVPEIGTFMAKRPPYVILTSNNTRDLSAALKRRCLHLFLDYPTAQRELEIVRSKNTGLPDALAAQLVEIVRGIRELELRKSPSISETIDWARTLAVLGVEELKASVLSDTAAVVVKYDRDVRRTLEALPRLVDPNARVPEHGWHGHGHGHGHGHDDDQHHDPVDPAAGRRRDRRSRDPRGEGRRGPPRRRLLPDPRLGTARAPDGAEAEGVGGPRHPQLRRGPGPQAAPCERPEPSNAALCPTPRPAREG